MSAPTDKAEQQTQRVRAAIVGAGLMGRWHAHALVRAGGTLVAVADPDSAAAQNLSQAYRVPSFASLDALLQQHAVDAVHVCAPLAAHVPLARTALEAGAHVLVEKPLAPTAAETEQLLMTAHARQRLLVPVHQFLFQSGVQALLAQLPRLQPLVHLELDALSAGADGGDDAARDALIGEILPHALALFARLVPNALDDSQWTVCRPAVGELRALGRSAQTALAINISTRARPTRNELSVLGAHGSAHVDLFHGFAVFADGRVSRAQKITQPLSLSARTLFISALNLGARALRGETAYPGLRALCAVLYHAIRANGIAPILPQETLAVARARDELLAQFLRASK